jgi:hypothetical protein
MSESNNNSFDDSNTNTTSSNSSPIITTTLLRPNFDPELSELLTRKQPKFAPQAPKCAKCQKSVYKAEEIRAANKTFHKLCFKCNGCSKLLEPNILTEHQGDLYCKNCYARKFGPKGYGYGAGAGILSSESSSLSTNGTTNGSEPSTPSAIPVNSPLYPHSTLKSTFSTLKSSR